MLIFLVVLCLIPVWGRPQTQATHRQVDQQPQLHSSSTASPIPIVSQSESVGADGSFNFSYETGNGIHVQEGGYIKKVQLEGRNAALNANGSSSGGDEDVQVITGAFSYTAPDGTVISLKYVADENGFQPEGDHLPTTPPIPPAIQRVLSTLSNKTEQQRSANYDYPIKAEFDDNVNQDYQGSPSNAQEESINPNVNIADS